MSLRRRDRALRVGQAGPACRHGHHGRVGRRSPTRRSACSARRSPSGGVVRGIVVPGGGSASRKDLDTPRRRGEVGRRRRPGLGAPSGDAVQSSALKAAGEAALGAALDVGRRRGGRPPAAGLRPGGRDLEGARASPPLGSEEPRLAEARRVRVHVGDRLPAARVGRGRAAMGGHAPPVHLARRGGHGPARARTPEGCSRRRTTSC